MKKDNSKLFRLFVIYLTLAIINGYLFNFLANESGLEVDYGFEKVDPIVKFLAIVVLAPVLETYLINYYPIKILEKWKVQSKIHLIIIPSILFSLFHYYNLIYVFMAFFGGLIMNSYYIKNRELSNRAIYWLMLLHSMYNLFGYLFVL
jgi:hypothetical protein